MTDEQYLGSVDQSQVEQNEALLAKAELGVILLDAYNGAVNLDPRLSDMKIVPIEDPEVKRLGYAIPKDISESGEHEVHIGLNDLDGILENFATAIRDYPFVADIISQRLGIEPSQFTPQLLYVFTLLHEMGHVTEHMDYEDRMDELRIRNRFEGIALPLGYQSLTTLMDTTSELRKRVDREWDELSTTHGVDDIEGLAHAQGVAYRNLTSERHADMFAVSVFDSNPHMLDQLTQPTVDAYRNFPMVV